MGELENVCIPLCCLVNKLHYSSLFSADRCGKGMDKGSLDTCPLKSEWCGQVLGCQSHLGTGSWPEWVWPLQVHETWTFKLLSKGAPCPPLAPGSLARSLCPSPAAGHTSLHSPRGSGCVGPTEWLTDLSNDTEPDPAATRKGSSGHWPSSWFAESTAAPRAGPG